MTAFGEATPLPGWTESLDDCRAVLDDARDALRENDFDRALTVCRDAPAARHAVSLARADLRARREDVPLYRHLGTSTARETLPVNATVGDADVDETVARARDAVDAGYPCLKLKVGVRSVDADLGRVRAVREACPDVALRLDANEAWSREAAHRAFDALADLDVAYVEQPLAAEDLAGHAALRDGHPETPVALDESLARFSVERVLAEGAADVAVLKPMALGGVDVARYAARVAERRGAAVTVTTTIDAVVARAGAVHLAAAVAPNRAHGVATGDLLARDLPTGGDERPLPVEGGAVGVPQGNGLGFSVGSIE
ncbi:mandelate racemase/muconate lactonizing enzyme family protein [Halospeciosus flavus]|uniref:mandelate racemase/muconate lactonizing enzyme family protein n=1 Tax=Halospeciosus flavus TaxID=3032283 RepID=UPI00361ADD08